jgi:N-methylhydantoinase B/oxoprolinase/acetone carboxylase alpha subunit
MAKQTKPQSKSKSKSKTFKPGDKVRWSSSGGGSVGKVEKRLTRTTQIKGHTAKPTKDNPEYLVRSDKSGKVAAHKPSELKRASTKGSTTKSGKGAKGAKKASRKSA